MNPITIRYSFQPTLRTLRTGQLADLFGLDLHEPDYVVAEQLDLEVRPGDVVLFTGPSGSGKSSLLRAVAQQWPTIDAAALPWREEPLIEVVPGTFDERLALLSACGLAEARLMLRTPNELSDGQRYRFRLALAFAHRPGFVVADEFAANLDRTLAKVLSYNVRRWATRTGIGVFAATTHDDVAADLRPNVHVHCHGAGRVTVTRAAQASTPQPISFAADLQMSEGTRADWDRFAAWHYRSHQLAFVRRVVVLWHGAEPIGVVVFTAPAASLRLRSHYFGLHHPRQRTALHALNDQLWLLARVVLHPTYRGAGLATDFVRQACRTCPVPWIETLAAMGHANPFFERAGFVRVGTTRADGGTYGGQYGTRARFSAATAAKSRYSAPVYYVFDNRVSSAT